MSTQVLHFPEKHPKAKNVRFLPCFNMENTTDFLEGYGNESRTRGISPGYLPISVEQSSENYPRTDELSSEIYPLPAKIVICVLLSLMIVTTIAGNVFVIAAILLEKSLRGVSNYLIMSLAVTDLMVAILVMPISVVDEVSADWNLGAVICDMWISFDVLCCTASILHLVAIAFDRYWAVSNIDYIRRRCAKQIGIMVLMVWLVAVTISIPPLFGWKDANDPNKTKRCIISQDLGYTIFSTLGAFYFPLILMLVLNIKIYVAARTRIRKKGFYGYQRPAPVSAMTVTATERHNISPNSSGSDVSQDRFSAYNGSCINMNELSRMHSAGELTEEHPTLLRASVAAPDTTAGTDGGACAENAGCGVEDKGGGTNDPKYSKLTNISCCVPRSTSETFKTTATITITTTAAAETTASSNRAKICDTPTNKLLVPSHGGGGSGSSGVGGKPLLTPKGQSRPAANGNIKRMRQRERERAKKEKIELKRERKAARVIAIITGGFVACWLPFFLVALIGPFCGDYCYFPRVMIRVFLWLGYLNSLLNPIIYTIFNPSFRTAFRKLIYGKYRLRSQCR